MIERLDERLGRVVARYVDLARRFAVLTLAIAVAATAAALAYTVRNLGIHGGTEEMLSSELPFREHWDEFRRSFPAAFDPFYVVVEGATAAQTREAAGALAAELSADRAHFANVYLPGGGPFFEQHGLLYLSPDELQDLADHLAEVQPYIGELSADTTLRGLLGLLTTGVETVRDGEETILDLAPVFDRLSDGIERALVGEAGPVSWEQVLLGDLASDGTFRVIVASPVFDWSDIQPQRAAMMALRGAVSELGLDAREGLRVRITGDPALEYDEIQTARSEATRAGLISFVLVTAILAAALRRLQLVLATLLTMVAGLILTAGFATAAVGHLNPVSVAFAVLFVGLSVDFGIHLCTRYRELLGAGSPHAEALRATASGVGSSLVLCAFTTAIGFWAFVPTDYAGVAELGLISGFGMLISLACTLSVVPAVLALRPLREKPLARTPAPAARLAALPGRHARAVCATAAVLGVGALALLPYVTFDHNPLRLRAQHLDSVTAFEDLLERAAASPWRMNVVAEDAAAADAVAERLRRLDTVEDAVTLSDYVPEAQGEKLAILEEIALFLGPVSPGDGGAPPPSHAEQLAALAAFERAVDELVAGGAAPELRESAVRLRDRLRAVRASLPEGAGGREELARLEARLLGDLPDGLRRLELALRAQPIDVADLPRDLIAATVSEDGRVRVEAYPSEDLNDNAALVRFVDSVREVTPTATGVAVVILESARAVVGAFQQALVSAVLVIGALLLFLWRRIGDAALVLIPLLLAALLTGAASVLLGIPFNFADVIVIPLLLGIGVDSGIHLVHRSRLDGGANLLRTSTARAVLFSTLTTIASFGSLGLSIHPGMASMGKLLTVGIALVLLCNLVLLPAMLTLRAGRKRPAV